MYKAVIGCDMFLDTDFVLLVIWFITRLYWLYKAVVGVNRFVYDVNKTFYQRL